MNYETERKFLVTGDFRPRATAGVEITQGYLSSVPQRTVRIRIAGEQALLTIKGEMDENLTRLEWEKEIDPADARLLLGLCEPGVIRKTRYIVPAGEHRFEVDVFHDDNEGLVLAEIELTDAGESFSRPDWLGEEVTRDSRYHNAFLARRPYTTW